MTNPTQFHADRMRIALGLGYPDHQPRPEVLPQHLSATIHRPAPAAATLRGTGAGGVVTAADIEAATGMTPAVVARLGVQAVSNAGDDLAAAAGWAENPQSIASSPISASAPVASFSDAEALYEAAWGGDDGRIVAGLDAPFPTGGAR